MEFESKNAKIQNFYQYKLVKLSKSPEIFLNYNNVKTRLRCFFIHIFKKFQVCLVCKCSIFEQFRNLII